MATNNTQGITITVNDHKAGVLENLPTDSSIGRNGVQGIWFETEVPFDASLMKQGTNVMTLTVPVSGANNGIIYDYLRLELDENAKPPAGN